MKNLKLMVGALVISTSVSLSAQAGMCEVDEAKVTNVFQWDDGSIFVSFDKAIGCGCTENSRAGFHKSDDEKVFISIALAALTSGKTVLARADNESDTCPIHGNTARLKALLIKNY